ncbi:MAG: SDR family NAD(P)-dependent oxidoreductase [Actinomycetota bacterium]
MDCKAERNAVITGAATGLGRSIALALARRGWRIGLVDIEVEEAERTLREVEESGGGGEVYRCDVRRYEEVQAVAEHFFTAWDRVDLLVNNAGVYGTACAEDASMEEWELIIDTDLWGVIYCCHAFIPRMKRQGGGHIVNIASAAGIVCAPETAPYSVAKAGVISLSEALKAELAPSGIGVTVVCPLFFQSHLFSAMTASDSTVLKDISLTAAANARVTTDDIAAMIVKAVEKNRLYVLPQLSARLFWWFKRLMPAAFYGQTAYLYKHGLVKPVFTQLAKRGLL